MKLYVRSVLVGICFVLCASLAYVHLAYAAPYKDFPATGRVIYVSTSGNDSNNGTSPNSPIKTLAKGQTMVESGKGDHLLLKRGDVWNESFGYWRKSGESASKMMVIGAYGTGARPIVQSVGTGIALTKGVSYLAIQGIQIRGMSGYDGFTYGISLMNAFDTIYLEDIKVEGFGQLLATQTCNGCTRRNLTINRSVFADAYAKSGHSQCMYVSEVTAGLRITENVITRCGVNIKARDFDPKAPASETPNVFKQGLYLQYNNSNDVLVADNLISDVSLAGIQLRNGGVIENNLIARTTVGIIAGLGPTRISNNVVIEGQDYVDRGVITGIRLNPTTNGVIENNIVAHSSDDGLAYQMEAKVSYSGDSTLNTNLVRDRVTNNGGYKYVTRNNIAYNAGRAFTTVQNSARGQIQNNTFVNASGQEPRCYAQTYASADRGNLSYSGNTFFCGGSTQAYDLGAAGGRSGFAKWKQFSGDTTAKEQAVTYANPQRTMKDLARSAGVGTSFESYMAAAVQQSRSNWKDNLTGRYGVNFFRDAFGAGSVPPSQGTVDVPIVGGGSSGGSTGGSTGGTSGSTGGGITPGGTFGSPYEQFDNYIKQQQAAGATTKGPNGETLYKDPETGEWVTYTELSVRMITRLQAQQPIRSTTTRPTPTPEPQVDPASITPVPQAGSFNLVTCGSVIDASGKRVEKSCRLVDLIEMFSRLINVAFFLMVLVILYKIMMAGWKYVTGKGNPSILNEAKASFTRLFIGLGLMLGAWLLFYFATELLLDPNVIKNPLILDSEQSGTVELGE